MTLECAGVDGDERDAGFAGVAGGREHEHFNQGGSGKNNGGFSDLKRAPAKRLIFLLLCLGERRAVRQISTGCQRDGLSPHVHGEQTRSIRACHRVIL